MSKTKYTQCSEHKKVRPGFYKKNCAECLARVERMVKRANGDVTNGLRPKRDKR